MAERRKHTRDARIADATLESGIPSSRAPDDSGFAALLRDVAHLPAPSLERGDLTLPLGSTLGSGRFRVLGHLGQGGLGVVYEVFDAERRETVALKLLSWLGADHVYRLKNEFRSLADLRHDNLVSLYELFAEGPRWYFTMALIDGEPFDHYVRPAGVVSIARLRSALAQLLAAVSRIHSAGKLHRDLKPSNVLVTAEGTLQVLDFGLSVDAEEGGVGQTLSEHAICGTPAYMAPEQAAGSPPIAASDLYAVGVMLFEALTGRRPFVGTTGAILAAKQRDEPPAPSAFDPTVPADLDVLCQALLARDPAARPLLATLVEEGVDERVGIARPPRTLFGREAELQALTAAYRAHVAGRAVVVRIAGESGIGKTALAEVFLDGLRGEPNLTLLSGRCYERESVPFKVFDPLIDALSRTLRRMPHAEVERLVPRDAFALTRLFPVLERVPAFVAPAPHAMPDAQALRQRAFPALGELLSLLRARGPVVILLDDLQWADLDSLRLLQKLLGDPAGFPGLLIASHRRERPASTRLSGVFEAARDHGFADVRTVELGPLPDEATTRLVADLCALRDGLDDETREAVVRESGGHPLFALELSQFAKSSAARAGATSLEASLSARIAALPDSARRVLEQLALSGEPLLTRVVLAAACASHDDVERLCNERLARVSRGHDDHGSGKTLECFHDRVRESVSTSLDEATRRAHARRLADVLTKLDDASAELLRRCLVEAGEYARAAQLAAEAAATADRALAFERATELWSQALAWADPQDRALRLKLGVAHGEALANAGRTREAADVFRSAAELASAAHRGELLRRAARHLLDSGSYLEGMDLLRRLCREAGVRIPRSVATARAEIVWLRARLKLRGLGLAPVYNAADARQIATLLTAAHGISNYFPLYGAALSLRHLLASLDAGDALQASLALGASATCDVGIGDDGERVDMFLTRMAELSPPDSGVPLYARFVRGTVLFVRGDFAGARSLFADVLAATTSEPRATIMRDLSLLYLQRCAQELGDLAALTRTTPPAIQEMFMHGRAWFGAVMTGWPGIQAWLVPDDPDAAERRLEEARRHWRPLAEPHMPDFLLAVADTTVLAYRGAHAQAFELTQRTIGEHGNAPWTKMFAAPSMAVFQAMSAVALLRTDPGLRRGELRAIAVRGVGTIRRASNGTFAAQAWPIEAALAIDRGDHDTAVARLRGLMGLFPPSGVRYGMCQMALGEHLGGDEGRAHVEAGRSVLHAHGVTNVEAFFQSRLGFCRP